MFFLHLAFLLTVHDTFNNVTTSAALKENSNGLIQLELLLKGTFIFLLLELLF